MGLGEPGDRRHQRTAANRQHDRIAHEQLIAGDMDEALAGEPRLAPHQLDPQTLEPGNLGGVVTVVDYLITPRQRCAHVKLAPSGFGGARNPPGLLERLGRAQQRL